MVFIFTFVLFTGLSGKINTAHAQLRNLITAPTFGAWNTYSMGYRFTPTVSGTITALWCYSNQLSTVTLWNDVGAQLAQTSVSCTSGWNSTAITPVSVTAGTYYRVTMSNGMYYQGVALPQTNGNITIDSGWYNTSCVNCFPNSNVGSNAYGLADVTLSTGPTPTPTPVPGSVTTQTSNSQAYNSFNVGITTVTSHSSYFGARFGQTNTGNCSTLSNDSGPTAYVGIATWTNYQFPVSSGVSPSTSYYYCAYKYNQTLGTYTYGNILGPVSTAARPAPVVNSYDAVLVDNSSAVISAGINAYGAASTGYFRWEQRSTAPASCASMPNVTTSGSTGSYEGYYYPVTYKLTTSPGLSYYYCFQSSNGAVGYSAVKSFTAQTLGTTGCSLFPGSTIATSGDEVNMNTWLGSSKFAGTRIYKASLDGWTAAAFHTKADNQGATITLIKNQINNQVFGGFNPYTWAGSGAVQGATAFLFNLTSGYKLNLSTYTNQQTYNNAGYGPTWGWGHELGMPNSTLNAAGVHYTNPSTHYEVPSSKGAYTYLDGGGGTPSAYNFTPSEIEVYKLSACTVSLPTITTPTKATSSSSNAKLGGNITSDGGAAIDARGVCYSTTDTTPGYASFDVPEAGVTCQKHLTNATGVFTVDVTGLPIGTINFRAFAHNSQGYQYTTNTTFTTLAAPTGLSPSSTTLGGLTTITWNPVPNATFYYIRTDDKADAWLPPVCDNGTTPTTGDVCQNPTTNSYSFNFQTGHTYKYWVHAGNANGYGTAAVVDPVTVIAPPVITIVSDSTTTTQAVLTAKINPNSFSSSAFFKWGTSATDTCDTMPNTVTVLSGQTGAADITFSTTLTPLDYGTNYYYCAGGTNIYGTSYSSGASYNSTGTPKMITTLTPQPTVITKTASYISSVARLMGNVNPNGPALYMRFRWGPGVVTDCSTLLGVTAQQLLGSQTTDVDFYDTISGLTAGTTYTYCAVAKNDVNAIVFGAPVVFTAPTGCIPPAAGDFTISSNCQLQNVYDGVDSASSATDLVNTATLTIADAKTLTVGPGKSVGYGTLTRLGTSAIVKFSGSNGIIKRGPLWAVDSDNDGYPDSTATALFTDSATITTPPAGYVRRSYASTNGIDCNSADADVFVNLASMAEDKDHDGYYTGTAAAQCVGKNSSINGRVYWNDSTNNYSYIYAGAGGPFLGTTDCDDTTGAPCLPTITSVASTSQTSVTVNWTQATGPTPTGYDVYYCDRSASGTCTPNIKANASILASTTFTYLHNSGLFCGKTYAYIVRAINDIGTKDSAVGTGSTSACPVAPTIGSPTSASPTFNSALLGATVSSDGGATIIARGICWSTATSSPILGTGTCVSTSGTTGLYTISVTGLPSSSRVYYRGFASNSVNTSYTASGIYVDTPAPVNKPIQNSGYSMTPWTSGAYNLGWEFTPVHDGQITELWGYFGGTGGATVYLYNRDTGVQLASASIGSNTAWTKATLGVPVSVQAGTVYILSFYSTSSTMLYYPNGLPMPAKYSGIKIFRGNQYNTPGPSTVIAGSMWEPFGVDLTYVQGTDSCRNLYVDSDNDGYAISTGATSVCSGVDASNYVYNTYLNINTNDCSDTDINTFPHQMDNFATPRFGGSWDYNCNGTIEYSLAYPSFQVCNNSWPPPNATAYNLSGTCNVIAAMPNCTSVGSAVMQACGGTATYKPGWYSTASCTVADFWYAIGQQKCR